MLVDAPQVEGVGEVSFSAETAWQHSAHQLRPLQSISHVLTYYQQHGKQPRSHSTERRADNRNLLQDQCRKFRGINGPPENITGSKQCGKLMIKQEHLEKLIIILLLFLLIHAKLSAIASLT
jgi:hypothetical protein